MTKEHLKIAMTYYREQGRMWFSNTDILWVKLGRERVCALVKEEVEKPGDVDGVSLYYV